MYKVISACIAAIGAALVVFMVTTEGELGAIPLGLLSIGVIGYLVARARQRSSGSRGPQEPST